MDEVISAVKCIFGGLISIIVFLLGSVDAYFWLFTILMGIDYFTGVVCAFIYGIPNSKRGLKGIIKKLMYIAFILFAYLVDFILLEIIHKFDSDFTFASIANISIGSLILIFFIGNESISIMENFAKMGIKIPKWFRTLCRTIRKFPNLILNSFIKENEEQNDKLDEEQEKFETELLKKLNENKQVNTTDGQKDKDDELNSQNTQTESSENKGQSDE
jgi:toxin secretion/phage lysis holin